MVNDLRPLYVQLAEIQQALDALRRAVHTFDEMLEELGRGPREASVPRDGTHP